MDSDNLSVDCVNALGTYGGVWESNYRNSK